MQNVWSIDVDILTYITVVGVRLLGGRCRWIHLWERRRRYSQKACSNMALSTSRFELCSIWSLFVQWMGALEFLRFCIFLLCYIDHNRVGTLFTWKKLIKYRNDMTIADLIALGLEILYLHKGSVKTNHLR